MTTTQLNTARYHGLNLTDLQILLLLADHGQLDMSDLAERIGLCNAAITRAAHKLVGKLLIQRWRSRWTDGRAVVLELTPLGCVRIHQITGRLIQPATA